MRSLSSFLLVALVASLGIPALVAADRQNGSTSYLDFGDWKARESLRPFWDGVQKEWWDVEARPELLSYCREFAKKTAPQQLIGEMIEDLKAEYSTVRHSCYIQVALHWPREATLKALEPYYRGEDQIARAYASDFIADIEETDAQRIGEEKGRTKQKAAQPGATDNPDDAQRI